MDVLFRSDSLNLKVSYDDGHKRIFRMIAPIARSGFLLSPNVDNAADFAALLRHRDAAPASRAVTSIRLVAYGSGRSNWQDRVTVRFFRFSVCPDQEASTKQSDAAARR